MADIHQTSFDISFKHCDPAGIVFYPRFTEMLNDVVEHWFKYGLGCDFAALHASRGLAIPTVRLEIDFKHPAFLGDILVASLSVLHVGTSSTRLRILFLSKDGAENLEAQLTIVFVGMGNKRPLEIPADLRIGIERFVSPLNAVND